MKKVNKFIDKNINSILKILIILGPILDLLVSVSINVYNHSLNIGILTRMFMLMFIYYVSIIIYGKKKNLIYIGLTLIYGVCFLIVQYDNTIMSNLHSFMRVFYFPLLLLGIYSIRDKVKVEDKTLLITLFIYIILIFVAVISGTGFESYKVAKVGSLGWFNSTNEISGIISILIPILFIYFSEGKQYILKLILLVIFLYVIVEIGTKTPVLSLIITLLTTFIYIFIKSIINKKYIISSSIIVFTIIISVVGVILIPRTNFYKNIKIHTKYLKITSIKEVITNQYVFDHFIFSQRITFYDKTDLRYEKVGISKKLFGMGYYNKKVKPYKEIEMDYYDVLYNHGIVGFVLYFSVYIYILFKVFKNLVKRINYSYLMKYLSLILILILSLFSGHIITTPAVSIYVVVIIIDLLKIKNSELEG